MGWEEERKNRIKKSVQEIHKYHPKYIFLAETSAIPSGFALKEAWKKAYPDEKLPAFYRIDPCQVMQYDSKKDYGKKISEERKEELENFLKKRIKDKDGLVLVFDSDPITGNSAGTIVNLLRDPKRFGLSEEVRHANVAMNNPIYPTGSDTNLNYVLQDVKGLYLIDDNIPARSIIAKSGHNDGLPKLGSDKDYNFRGRIVKKGKLEYDPSLPPRYQNYKPHDILKRVKVIGRQAGEELHTELKKKKTLENDLAVIGIASLSIGLFFLSSNITGNVIGSNLISNYLGAILLIIGLIAGFFWLKSRKK